MMITERSGLLDGGKLWLVGPADQEMVVAISNLFYDVIRPLLTPIPNFIQIGRKTPKNIDNFYCWSVLVGQTGRSKNGCSHFKLVLCCFWSITSPHTKFYPNRTKNIEVFKFLLWVSFNWSGW